MQRLQPCAFGEMGGERHSGGERPSSRRIIIATAMTGLVIENNRNDGVRAHRHASDRRRIEIWPFRFSLHVGINDRILFLSCAIVEYSNRDSNV